MVFEAKCLAAWGIEIRTADAIGCGDITYRTIRHRPIFDGRNENNAKKTVLQTSRLKGEDTWRKLALDTF